jgi:hypothetical protein
MLYNGYIIKFGVPDMNNKIYTEDSFTCENCKQFEDMKANGTIEDYEIDNIGVKITIDKKDNGDDEVIFNRYNNEKYTITHVSIPPYK